MGTEGRCVDLVLQRSLLMPSGDFSGTAGEGARLSEPDTRVEEQAATQSATALRRSLAM